MANGIQVLYDDWTAFAKKRERELDVIDKALL